MHYSGLDVLDHYGEVMFIHAGASRGVQCRHRQCSTIIEWCTAYAPCMLTSQPMLLRQHPDMERQQLLPLYAALLHCRHRSHSLAQIWFVSSDSAATHKQQRVVTWQQPDHCKWLQARTTYTLHLAARQGDSTTYVQVWRVCRVALVALLVQHACLPDPPSAGLQTSPGAIHRRMLGICSSGLLEQAHCCCCVLARCL